MKTKLVCISMLVLLSAALISADPALSFDQMRSGTAMGSASLSGASGYIVLPSAEPSTASGRAVLSTGYSFIAAGPGIAHIPYIKVGFAEDFELYTSFDFSPAGFDMQIGGMWRFDHRGGNSMAVGVNGQLLEAAVSSSSLRYALQLYYVSTFASSFIDWPAKATLLAGYTIDGTPSTDIDFGLGFAVPFFADVFNDKAVFLIDFGNVSYSDSPSAGKAQERGLINLGIRMLPITFGKSVLFSIDLRALDILDESGRAVSTAFHLSFI
jgi:hypothetical protein